MGTSPADVFWRWLSQLHVCMEERERERARGKFGWGSRVVGGRGGLMRRFLPIPVLIAEGSKGRERERERERWGGKGEGKEEGKGEGKGEEMAPWYRQL